MKTSQFVNLTPHAIKLNCGVEFPPSGDVLRVSDTFHVDIVVSLETSNDPESFAYRMPFYEVESSLSESDLPPFVMGTRYIVSAMALAAIKALKCSRYDFVTPATGHPDCIRNEKGQIVSVPGFVRLGGAI